MEVLINGDRNEMTERQYRMRSAGLQLMRAATLIGGGVGTALLITVMTWEQRLGCGFVILALAMPIVLLALTVRPTGLDRICFVGAAVMSAVAFVEVDLYLALLTMGLIGALLVGAVRLMVAVRPAGRLG